MRKHHRNEYTCNCSAYDFPHRFGGGACNGYYWVADYWEDNWGCNECDGCIFNEGDHCQIVEGQDKPKECPALQDFARYEEIKL